MLTAPQLVERADTPYVAIREKVDLPFGPVVDRLMPQVANWLGPRGGPDGPALLRYDWVEMPALEVQFGFLTSKLLAGEGHIRAGILPAGRYAHLTWFGHYDQLMDANAVLIGWMKEKHIEADAWRDGGGDRFACRAELYPNGPMDEPDPAKWQTDIIIRIKG